MNSERLAAEGFSAAKILFAEPHDFSRLTEGMAAAAVRVPPRSVRKLGIRALKLSYIPNSAHDEYPDKKCT